MSDSKAQIVNSSLIQGLKTSGPTNTADFDALLNGQPQADTNKELDAFE